MANTRQLHGRAIPAAVLNATAEAACGGDDTSGSDGGGASSRSRPKTLVVDKAFDLKTGRSGTSVQGDRHHRRRRRPNTEGTRELVRGVDLTVAAGELAGTRCPLVFDRCPAEDRPLLRVGDRHRAACLLHDHDHCHATGRPGICP